MNAAVFSFLQKRAGLAGILRKEAITVLN